MIDKLKFNTNIYNDWQVLSSIQTSTMTIHIGSLPQIRRFKLLNLSEKLQESFHIQTAKTTMMMIRRKVVRVVSRHHRGLIDGPPQTSQHQSAIAERDLRGGGEPSFWSSIIQRDVRRADVRIINRNISIHCQSKNHHPVWWHTKPWFLNKFLRRLKPKRNS